MPGIGFGVPSKGTLKEALGEIPSDFRGYFRAGFSGLTKVETRNWPGILAVSQLPAPVVVGLELEQAAADLGVDTEELLRLATAARLLLGILAFRTESVADFTAAATDLGILDSKDVPRISEFAETAAKDRQALKQALLASSLQSELLPSLTQFEVKIDVRLDFEKEKVTNAVPVTLVHIDTDSSEKELWFQMTPSQVEGLAAKLQQVVKQLKEAEQLAKKLV